MKSIKSAADIGRKKKDASKSIFKTSFALLLIVFAFTMSSPSSFFQIIKPAEAAGTLTNVSIVPTNNIVNTRGTYDIFFKTATTGTIKIIHMTFPTGFDVSSATKLIERSGIGAGILSAPSSTTLIYTVNSPVIVPAGTTIRLEIGRIVNSNTAGNFKVSITTERTTTPIIIDGPTLSTFFPIKDIGTNDIGANSVTSSKIVDNSVTSSKIVDNSVTSSKILDNSIIGDDISTGFMIRKTMHDDTAGHANGWNPDASTTEYAISDSDISGAPSSEFVSVMILSGNPVFCAAAIADAGLFGVYCNLPPGESAELDYIITKLPPHDGTTSLSVSSSESTPSSESPSLSSSSRTSVLPDIASINRQDDIASEFP